MKRIFGIAMIGLLFAVGTASAEEPIVLKFGHHNPPHIPIMVNAYIPWYENINKAAQDTIRIDLYPAAVLGRDITTWPKLLKDGVMDIAHLTCMFYPPWPFP